MEKSETADRTDPLHKVEATGKPDFSVVYATRLEFLRTTGSIDLRDYLRKRGEYTERDLRLASFQPFDNTGPICRSGHLRASFVAQPVLSRLHTIVARSRP